MREATATVTIGWHSALNAIQKIVREGFNTPGLHERFCLPDAEALEQCARMIRKMKANKLEGADGIRNDYNRFGC